MIKVMQDLHVRREEPFSSASENTLRDVLSSLGNGDTLIQTGDWFHTSKPFPEDYRKTMDLLQDAIYRGVRIVILSGNHDYHYDQESYATSPLSVLGEDLEVISEPSVRGIEGLNFLFLPWMPHTKLKKEFGVGTLKEYYEDVFPETLKIENIDYVVYHFEDETVFMGGVNTGVDLRFLEARYPNIKRLGGHVHLQSKNYIGTPFQTRYDEKGQTGRVAVIFNGEFSYEDLNDYLVYLDVNYNEDFTPPSETSVILTITEAPSVRSAYDKFKGDNVFIRKVELSIGEERELSDDKMGDATLREMMDSFIEKNKVDKQTSQYVLELL